MYVLLCLLLQALGAAAQSGQPTYSPARPPAVPLAVHSPYTSAWSSTANGGTLNSNDVIFWTGQRLGWEGVITVDGVAYEWMGRGFQALPSMPSVKTAEPLAVAYDSQSSNFTFAAGPVEVTARFFSPVAPQDLCRTSVPLSYLEVSYAAADNATHDVQLYGDVDASWNNFAASANVDFALHADEAVVGDEGRISDAALFSWTYRLSQEYDFSEVNDFPQWGLFAYSTAPGEANSFTYQSGDAIDLRFNYVMDQVLTNEQSGSEIFAFSHDFGSSTSGSALYTVGTIQDPVINYLTSAGLEHLRPWWTTCYSSDPLDLIAFHYDDFSNALEMGAQWESRLKQDVDAYYKTSGGNFSSGGAPTVPPTWSNDTTNGTMSDYTYGVDQLGQHYMFDSGNAYGFLDLEGEAGIAIPDVSEASSYYAIVALSARQTLGAYVLTTPPELACSYGGTSFNMSEPFMFQKEISSNGNMNTVDVLYPAMPFFLYANPDMMRYSMNPLFLLQESGFYPKAYSMHDIGANFPNATSHVEGNDEAMPVEESGNMILMSYAYYKFSGDSVYLADHYDKLSQWANFLIEYTLIPFEQLSTDDFLGTLENQTNLAIKGIVGLEAMAGIARVVGNDQDAANFSSTSADYYDQWEDFAIAPSGEHTVLAYQWHSSWGLLYNSYPDKLLNLGVISQDVYDMQSAWYARVSQLFGLPLDNRHSLTKSDWELWTAATCAPATRRLIVDAVAYWLNNTSTDLPFTDLYDTIATGGYPQQSIRFIARPVAGGHFALLAMLKAGIDSDTGTGLGGFPLNSTEPVVESRPLPVLPAVTPSRVPSQVLASGSFTTSTSVIVTTTLM
ncbi:hypothetical protein BDY21DRAFT_65560 [Lineolata rhizophorae]|uniref:Glutaminase A n=1 Tax=Lineolata rhizophorae TaxID=578093 RepID=A0A6A6NWB3_9PEZI|nr:hypothetical protein BDY21DRAFT_65560 [Lineolata rhizophorae]